MKPAHHHDTKAYQDYSIHQAGKDIRYLREDDIKEDMDLAVSLEDSLKHALLKRGAKTLGREALKSD